MKTMIFDINEGFKKGDIVAFETDNLSDEYLITLLKDKRRLPLTNKMIKMVMIDKNTMNGEMMDITIVDASKGEIKIEITDKLTKKEGLYTCQLIINGENGYKENSVYFWIQIKKSLINEVSGDIIADPSFKILTDKIAEVEEWNRIFSETMPNIEERYEQRLNVINNRSDFLLKQVLSFTSYNREFYLDLDGAIKTKNIQTPTAAWWILDNVSELSFKVVSDSKWLHIGNGDDYSEYSISINIKGLDTAKIIKLTKGGEVFDLNAGISREQAVIDDYITVKHEGDKVVFTKNNKKWFVIDTTGIVELKNKNLGIAHGYDSYGFWSCSDFMGIESLNKFQLNNPISIWDNKKFISLGDSITWQDGKEYQQGAEIGKVAHGYQTILKEQLGFSNYLNVGVSGRPIANGSINGVGTNTTGKEQDYSNFDLAIIAGGTNDFKLNIPLGEIGVIGDADFNTNTFYGAYRDLIEYILKNKPNIRICLFTPLQRDNGGYDVNKINEVGNKLIDYVNAILEIGEMYGIPVCDMYRNSGFNKFTLDIFTMDGLHPNNTGYKRMGGYATKFINNIGL